MELTGLRVLVTGASSGIGRELAGQFISAGASVIAHGRDPHRLAALAERHPSLNIVEADISNEEGRRHLAEEVERLGGIDILVNNAGIQVAVDARNPIGWSHIDTELRTNLHAPIHLIHLLMPSLMNRRGNAPRAAIVNITSGLALAPKSSGATYCASKAAMRSYTKSLRWQLRNEPVHVIEALPPLVKTPMTDGRNDDGIPADECARQIVRGIEQDKREIYVGKSKLLRIIMRVSPGLGERIMRDY